VTKVSAFAVAAQTHAAEPEVNGAPSERRCLACGLSLDRDGLIRFVVDPQGMIVPDVDERLPGRGLWVSADRDAIEAVLRRKLFAKAAKQAVRVPDNLPQQVEAVLARRCRELIGLARRAGQAVFGYQKVRERLMTGIDGLLLEATDGADGDCRKLRSLAPQMQVVRALSAAEIGAGIGREYIVHGVVQSGRLAERLVRDASRLQGLRSPAPFPSQPAQSM
jgi:predicted RNA-binding protein YlxR (DUF448 family)